MDAIEAITKDLFGVALPNLECDTDGTINVNHCSMDIHHSRQFGTFVKIVSSRDHTIKNLELLQAVIQVGTRLSKAKLISNNFWWTLMVS